MTMGPCIIMGCICIGCKCIIGGGGPNGGIGGPPWCDIRDLGLLLGLDLRSGLCLMVNFFQDLDILAHVVCHARHEKAKLSSTFTFTFSLLISAFFKTLAIFGQYSVHSLDTIGHN